jgi:biotin carboxylase
VSSILVLGAGFDQRPLIRCARERGLRTVVLDEAQTPVGLADCDLRVRRSPLDLRAVVEVASAESVAFIASVGFEPAVPVIAAASDSLGLPTLLSSGAAQAATRKDLMKQRMRAAGIRTSRQVVLAGEDLSRVSELTFPVVVKPQTGTGGRGVSAADTMGELLRAIEVLRRDASDPTVVVEEFVVGPEVTVDCFTAAGSTHLVCVSDLVGTPAASPRFSTIRCHSPASLTEDQIMALSEIATRLCGAFEIRSGPWLFQAKLTPQPSVIEMGARIAGGRKPRFVKLATGVDLLGAYLDDLSGRPADLQPQNPAPGATVTYVYGHAGTVAGYRGVEAVLGDGAEYVEVFRPPGSRLTGGLTPRDRILEFGTLGADPDRIAEWSVLQRIDCFDVDGSSLIRRDLYDERLI